MIVVSGAAGFIASFFVKKLNQEGYEDIVLVDDFSVESKGANWEGLTYTQQVDREDLFDWIAQNENQIQFIFHLGARTDTTEFDTAILDKLNLNYSKQLWQLCVQYGLPMVYASSAATYGMGEHGYEDSHEVVNQLEPLNPYGVSKNEFDKWALSEEQQPYFWAGLKFFNVYGPHENHKGRMASVVWHTFNQVSDTGAMKLFRSHREDYKDGEQLRDFIYVKDVAEVLYFLMHHRKDSGLYNLGTGQARTFLDLVTATFVAMGKEPQISFIDTPVDIRDKYQYFTEAKMDKLRSIGYHKPFTSLEDGVRDYVQEYLMKS
jgi:ADP-L-glycero-D-manno-heptose 6-epimerase